MINLRSYMEDGANWQAQAVLAYMKANYEWAVDPSWDDERKAYDAEIFLYRYENCRENGYIFSLRFDDAQLNFAVFEAANSDDIFVLINNEVFFDTPNASVMRKTYKSKYDCDISFKVGHIVECGNYIVNEMRDFIKNIISKDYC